MVRIKKLRLATYTIITLSAFLLIVTYHRLPSKVKLLTTSPGRLHSPGQPALSPGQPALSPGQPALSPGQPALSLGQSALSPGQPALSPGQPALSPGQTALSPGQPALSPGQPALSPGQPAPTWEEADVSAWQRRRGIGSRPVHRKAGTTNMSALPLGSQESGSGFFFTHDDWPHFPVRPFHLPPNASLPPSPFNPDHTIQWEFDTSAFLRRPHVNVSRPKVITWMVHLRYLPKMPQPVRMRVCPEMPCLMTSDPLYAKASAALVWWVSRFPWEELPPARTSWGPGELSPLGVSCKLIARQHRASSVFVIHNHESPHAEWSASPVFPPVWASLFNWTISYREDSDILSPYGYFYRRPSPPAKNYTAIVLQKSRMAVWMASHCLTPSRREKYVTLLQKFVSVDIIGGCGNDTCQRRGDNECGDRISRQYKFYLAFENALCPDYVTEKVFRFFAMDLVLVVRAGEGHKKFIPPGTYIDTADFGSVRELADYLVHLDHHPEDYIKILQAKDRYQALFLDYPMRSRLGNVIYMVYHYEAVALCELCRRLWELDSYRNTVPDINDWLVRGQCVPPKDLH